MGYKMIINNSVVDADVNPCYMRYNAKLDLLLMCPLKDAQFVASRNGDTVWHIANTINTSGRAYQTVELIEADDEEILALMDAFDSKRTPIIISAPVVKEQIDEVGDDAVAIIKQHTIDKMKSSCEDAIENGFDVVLSDGNAHHFTLTSADYLNLIALSAMKDTFADGIPYRATDEDVCFYSHDDFSLIMSGAARCRSNHYVYCQNLCNYVNTLETLPELQGISYGMSVPDEYQITKGVV